jgi:lysophospholipase L1-like esterase
MKKICLLLLTVELFACNGAKKIVGTFNPIDFTLTGRAVKNTDSTVTLIASASALLCTFEGTQCTLYLKNVTYPGDYNYVNIELDGEYKGRYKIDGTDAKPLLVNAENNNATHKLIVSKATEALNGLVIITKIEGKNVKRPTNTFTKRIEFIGNSITCGYGNDLEIPCGGKSKWYDQHNAYWSYASIVARSLNMQYMISAISGAGVYRVWNAEGPSVPAQYENAFLNTDSLHKWDFKNFTPDIVVIALGTNDISDGDGSYQRPPFDKAKFITHYKDFIRTIYSHYSNPQIVLLNSPLVGGARGKLLESFIDIVKDETNKELKPVKPIQSFYFLPMQASGCGHPSIADDKVMADQLGPFLKKIL